MLTLWLLQEDRGLTLREMLADIPHDAGAFVVYGILAFGIFLIWRGSRGKA